MVPEAPQSIATLVRLRQEISEDRLAMAGRSDEIEESRTRLDERPWASHAAVALHGWYTALEAALERVARDLDGEVPRGERWHRDLLSQATLDVPGVRPAVLPRVLFSDLLDLLAFRHFFRHGYGIPIDADKITPELDRVRRIQPQVAAALDRFDHHLGMAVEALHGKED